jgi:hypothetical protein
MTLEALSIWKSTFKAQVVPTAGPGWPDFLTDWYAQRFNTPMLSLPGLTIAGALPVVFGSAAFRALYATLAAGLSQSAAVNIIANAWAAGLAASTVTVAPGSSIGTPSPATTFSTVATSIFDAPSILLGKAKILELIGAPNVADALDSQTPIKFREATLLLTVTTTGLNSLPPPGGPTPLVDAARAVG